MTRRYAVVFEQSPTGFGAYVPDLPGCGAVANSRAEVERLIQEALEFHVEGMRLNNDRVPEPTTEVGYVEIDMSRIDSQAASERSATTGS
jgi:predicted RNase H-like HicB family nuclease